MTTEFSQEKWICDVQSDIKAFGGGQSTSSTNTTPWKGQQPYLTDVMGQAQNQFNNFTPQFYPGQTQSNFNPGETSAISGIENTGMNGTSALNAANTSTANILSGDPAHNQAIAAGVVPGLESQFAQGNAMNSPAAAYAVSQGLGTALLNDQNQAAQTAQGLYQTTLGGQQAALGAGQTQQTQDQAQLQSLIDRWNFGQQQPYSKLNQYSNLVGGQYGGTSTTTQPQSSFFSSLFSDRRLKEDICEIATLPSGIKVYTYRFKGSEKREMGFIADEVQRLYPEAVTIGPFDMLMVNYGMVQ